VPGNHDIGDNPHPDLGAGEAVDATRLAAWRDALGADRWSLELDGWTVVAINAQLVDSGLAAEADQWTWLGEQLAGLAPDRPAVLVTHKPLAGTPADLDLSPPSRFLAVSARDRLADLPGAEHISLVVSGHVHQSRVLEAGGRRHVWAPTTWAVLPDTIQPVFGAKRCGVVSITLGAAGRADVEIVEPPGVAQHVLGEDVPNPYRH
jgi:3',5'-cyclic AMP phosphodiesterase CpdA